MVFLKRYLLFLTGLFLYSTVFSQTYEIDYRIQVHKNKKILDGISSSTQLVFDEMDSLEMRLLFDENKALSSYPKRSGLSIKKERIIKRASRLVVGLTHTYFHDLQEEKKVEIKEFNGVNYVIESAIQIFKWRFINEKKTISGYECLKAMTTLELLNRKGITDTLKITAWYTKEIPYSFGPKNM